MVGENGAGKTTLIKLLTGLYREYEGEILYNGVEMRRFPREEWFKIFSCVFQDFARYYLSVEENICLGTGDIGFTAGEETDIRRAERTERMENVAKQLGIHDAMSDLKYGYGTRLGKLDEDSVDLSGGQWQRLAVARELYRDHDMIILEEPTAAIDPLQEADIYHKFAQISKNKTAFIVTHRLGSAQIADRIIVMDAGSIVDMGTHEELMHREGKYREMYQAQAKWYQ